MVQTFNTFFKENITYDQIDAEVFDFLYPSSFNRFENDGRYVEAINIKRLLIGFISYLYIRLGYLLSHLY